VVWDAETGKPYYNAIVWQDTRTDGICQSLAEQGGQDRLRPITGLPLSTYFAGTKLRWLLDQLPELEEAAQAGRARFGTVDSWLVWLLTGGPSGGVHITDVTNASRTLLMDLESLSWSQDCLRTLMVPESLLPEIRPSVLPGGYGKTQEDGCFGEAIPVSAILGDQQSALFGQACFESGEAKNTYGTGCFLLMNTGQRAIPSENGLLTTVGYQTAGQPAVYALEGSVAVAGSLVQWLRDKIGLIETAPEIEELAAPDNGGVYFVPAFSGLFAPYWQNDARGVIVGLTHAAGREHLARAVLEATAFQTREIFEVMGQETGLDLPALKADGGMTANGVLMQFQADLLGVPVQLPEVSETTVLGACYAAGLAEGFFEDPAQVRDRWKMAREWTPQMSADQREELYGRWKEAVKRSMGWA
jgi:glycerol kinase